MEMKKNSKILFIGTVDFSYHCLNELFKMRQNIVGVLTRKHSDYNSDFKDLTPLAKKNKVPVHYVDSINAKAGQRLVQKYSPDVVLCFGWSEILKPWIFKIVPGGVIGSHPSLLPENRGNHPLIWALALGLRNTGLSFFYMNEQIDAGTLVSQRKIAITEKDDARSLYGKIKVSASQQLRSFVPSLPRNIKNQSPSQNRKGNYWRRRGPIDGQIDWRMSKNAICNLVRALTKPYVGAHCLYNDKDVKIWRVKARNASLANVEPGKVLNVNSKRISVKCYDGVIDIVDHEFKTLPKKGEYLLW